MSKQKLIIWPIFLLTLALTPAKAQITPDNTLGQEKSQITPFDAQSDIIEGGATRGSNLFHSFREFNIGEGRAAYFANPEIIQNIFSRVTGSNPSKIFGTLGVLGNANLFFLNPNGIIFGPNSSLDIRGSFTATTANSLIFPDSSRFNATNPNPAPILTIDVPVPLGIEFEGRQTGAIINTGFLFTEQNLVFVTGTVVNTGILFSPTNRISIATVNPEVKTILEIDAAGKILSQSTQPITTPNPSEKTGSFVLTVLKY
jgi:filamentous hemagglutinin family protein